MSLAESLLRIERLVAISRRYIPTLVQGPEVVREIVIVQIAFAIDDGPSRRIYVGNAVYRHSVGAITAVLRKVLLWVGPEPLHVRGGSESIGHTFPAIGVLIHARGWLADSEVRHRVITLDSGTP